MLCAVGANREIGIGANENKVTTRGTLHVRAVGGPISVNENSQFQLIPRVADERIGSKSQRTVDVFNQAAQFLRLKRSPCVELFCNALDGAQQVKTDKPAPVEGSHAN